MLKLIARVFGFFKACALIGATVIVFGMTTPLSAEVGLENNPVFQEFRVSGLTRGNRGAGQENRFAPYLDQFVAFAPASQDFILRAFEAGRLTQVAAGKDLTFENGKLAVNLIVMLGDIEAMTRFVETRAIPENRNVPKASDNFDRMMRDFPDVAEVLTPTVRGRILELEAQVIAVLEEEVAKEERRLSTLKAGGETLDRQIVSGQQLNKRLEDLLSALPG